MSHLLDELHLVGAAVLVACALAIVLLVADRLLR